MLCDCLSPEEESNTLHSARRANNKPQTPGQDGGPGTRARQELPPINNTVAPVWPRNTPRLPTKGTACLFGTTLSHGVDNAEAALIAGTAREQEVKKKKPAPRRSAQKTKKTRFFPLRRSAFSNPTCADRRNKMSRADRRGAGFGGLNFSAGAFIVFLH